ncbi:FtsL-like putative cell division protein [Anaerophaga thermohalophila]|uniref:FtsL-like putative cell division protein n=1 Tax=Anaerophaga thermohalophila TaxID=177400 RepID=UPI0002D38C55|nr:FtsL-like putative cell division protein [Anaerophaga thermohalophila]
MKWWFKSKQKTRENEFLSGKEEFNELKGISFKEFLHGRFLAGKGLGQHWGFMTFIVFLAVLYIGNRYQMEHLLDRQADLMYELKELKYEAITTSSELMNMSKQSEVMERVHEAGIELEVLKTPPRILKVKKIE